MRVVVPLFSQFFFGKNRAFFAEFQKSFFVIKILTDFIDNPNGRNNTFEISTCSIENDDVAMFWVRRNGSGYEYFGNAVAVWHILCKIIRRLCRQNRIRK